MSAQVPVSLQSHEHIDSLNRMHLLPPSIVPFIYIPFSLLFTHSNSSFFVVHFSEHSHTRAQESAHCSLWSTLMEHWHTSTAAPYLSSASGVQSSRVLTSSTGNIQSYALDSNEGIENQNPYPPGAASIKHENRADSQYPIPRFKLGSNDQHAENIARLQARRQQNREKFGRRRRIDPERPYLLHPKYLQYRARQRCDTGADGKPVWDDRIEDAFQNGKYGQ